MTEQIRIAIAGHGNLGRGVEAAGEDAPGRRNDVVVGADEPRQAVDENDDVALVLREAARAFGDLLVADVAARAGQVRVNGWREGTTLSADELVGSLAEMGYRHLVFTDIARDGMRSGIDAEAYRHIAQVAGFPVVASGGIATLDDLRSLAALGYDVIEGAIMGRALYEGEFSLAEALEVIAC